MRFLFAYGYSTGATPYYYERALKEVAEVITCGPSSDRGKKHDIPCSKNADILPIIKNTKPDYFLLFPEANNQVWCFLLSVKCLRFWSMECRVFFPDQKKAHK